MGAVGFSYGFGRQRSQSGPSGSYIGTQPSSKYKGCGGSQGHPASTPCKPDQRICRRTGTTCLECPLSVDELPEGCR